VHSLENIPNAEKIAEEDDYYESISSSVDAKLNISSDERFTSFKEVMVGTIDNLKSFKEMKLKSS